MRGIENDHIDKGAWHIIQLQSHIRFLENMDNLEKETYVKGDMGFKV